MNSILQTPTPDTFQGFPESHKTLTYKEAAELLGLSQKTVENHCRDGTIPRVYLARHSPRIRLGDLIAFIDRGGVGEPTTRSKSGTVPPYSQEYT